MTTALRYQSDQKKCRIFQVEFFEIISTLCLSTSRVYSLCTKENCLTVDWREMWKRERRKEKNGRGEERGMKWKERKKTEKRKVVERLKEVKVSKTTRNKEKGVKEEIWENERHEKNFKKMKNVNRYEKTWKERQEKGVNEESDIKEKVKKERMDKIGETELIQKLKEAKQGRSESNVWQAGKEKKNGGRKLAVSQKQLCTTLLERWGK